MTRMTGPDCVVMCNLVNTHTHTHTHTHTAWRGGYADALLHRRQATWWKVCRKDRARTSQVTNPSNVWTSCRSVRRRPGAPVLSVQVLNGNRHKSNHLARNHPRTEPSAIRRPRPIYLVQFIYPLCPRKKIYQGTAASVAAH